MSFVRRPQRWVTRSVVFGAALSFIACGGGDGPAKPKSYTVAGVTTIENPPRAKAPLVFRLGDSVIRDIGGLKERADDEFNHSNGFLSGVSLSNGGLVVADWTRVRLFDSIGTQTAVIGRRGSGPNEFQGLYRPCRTRGDTVLVFDGNNRRMSVLTASGAIVRQFPMNDGRLPVEGCLNDGTAVATRFVKSIGEVMTAPATRFDLHGVDIDTIGAFPAMGFAGVSQYMGLIAHDRWIYVSDPRKNEVRRYRAPGGLDRIVRMADAPRAINDRDASYWLGGPVAAAGSGASGGSAPAVQARHWPFYRGILVDRDHRLWIRDFPTDEDAPDRWTAYDTSGAVIGALLIPRGPRRAIPNPPPGAPTTMRGFPAEFVDAFGDFIILLERDEDGAAHFRTRRIR